LFSFPYLASLEDSKRIFIKLHKESNSGPARLNWKQFFFTIAWCPGKRITYDKLDLAGREKEVVFGLKFECQLKADEFPEGVQRILLDQDITIPLGKMLLIGFSSKDSALKKTVYFLAAHIQKNES
jgi:hypothetical protein